MARPGAKPKGERPMTNAERQKAYRAKVKATLTAAIAKGVEKPPVFKLKMNLPRLDGSPKQIEWAKEIRESRMLGIQAYTECLDPKAVQKLCEDLSAGVHGAGISTISLSAWQQLHCLFLFQPEISIDHVARALDRLTKIDSAHWWIENRERTAAELVTAILVDPKSAERGIAIDPAVAIARAEAMGEATLQPSDNADAKGVVIEAEMPTESIINLRYPGFSERFNAFVKLRRFHWNKPYWSRDVDVTDDVFIEVCNDLLGRGYSVRIFNNELRAKVASGEYQPEPVLIIEAYPCKSNELQFRFKWRKSGGFVGAIHKLPGSRVFNDAALVRADCWEEVLDIAEVHGFVLKPEVAQVVEIGKALEMKVKTIKPRVRKYQHVEKKIVDLPPATGLVDSSLMDDINEDFTDMSSAEILEMVKNSQGMECSP